MYQPPKKIIAELKKQQVELQRVANEMSDELEYLERTDEEEREAEAQLSDLLVQVRRVRKQREILEDPDAYVQRLLNRSSLLFDAARAETNAVRQAELRAEADGLLARVRKALKYMNQIDTLLKEDVDALKAETEQLRKLAKERKEGVKDLDKFVSISAGILEVVAKLLPLAALAV